MKRLLSTCILLIAAITAAFGQPLTENQTKAAQHCLQLAIREAKKALPVTQGAVRTDSLKLKKSSLKFFNTITDPDAFSKYKEDASSLCNASQENDSLIFSLAADLGMSMENVYRSPDQSSEFSVKFSNDDLKGIFGGDLTRETRRKAVTNYLSGVFLKDFPEGIEISVSDKEIGFLQPLNVKFKNFPTEIDKDYYLNVIKAAYAKGAAESILYDMCIYAGMNFTGYLKFTDQVVISSVPYSHIVKASQEGLATAANDGEKAIPFDQLEQKPMFNGHEHNTFSNWVNGHLKYPKEAQEFDIQGTVVLSFIIEKDGSVTDVSVLKGPNPDLNKEALRVVKMSPKWTPGMVNGQPVRVTYTFTVVFELK